MFSISQIFLERERAPLQDGHQHPKRQPLPHQAEGLLHRVQRHRQHDSREVMPLFFISIIIHES
jgi:hypothetical protein